MCTHTVLSCGTKPLPHNGGRRSFSPFILLAFFAPKEKKKHYYFIPIVVISRNVQNELDEEQSIVVALVSNITGISMADDGRGMDGVDVGADMS